MTERHDAFTRLLAVWNGEAELDELDSFVSPSYRGHLGSRDRDLAQLKQDIAAYRTRLPDVRFHLEHQFGEGDHLASRLTAHAPTRPAGKPPTVYGLNISRWEDHLLVEEWAVWETFSAD